MPLSCKFQLGQPAGIGGIEVAQAAQDVGPVGAAHLAPGAAEGLVRGSDGAINVLHAGVDVVSS